MPGKAKGQFFIAGALLLSVLFLTGLPALAPRAPDTSDMESLSRNLEREIPRALNLALLEDGDPGRLADFSGFLRQGTSSRYMGMELLWVAAVPDPDNPGDVDVTAGNWLGRPVSASVTIDSVGVNIVLADGEHQTRSFSGLGGTYEMEVLFEERSWSDSLPRDKANLYAHLALSRGGNVIVKEIAG